MITTITQNGCLRLKGLKTEINKIDTSKLANGSEYFTIDTSELYLYDKEHDKWLKQPTNIIIGL